MIPALTTDYPDIAQSTEEWHDLRRGIVTASTVGRLLTPTRKVASNDTSRGVVATLVAERITGVTEETAVSSDMWRGVIFEPVARDLYSAHHAPAVEHGFTRLDGDGWTLGYSPDGMVGDTGLIEIKCPRAKTHLQTTIADEVPEHYMAQCQAALLVSGREWIDFVSYVGGMPLYVKRVTPDATWHDAIIAAARAFETTAADMTAAYTTATRGLPNTERLDDPDDIQIKVA